ncbi:MAG: VWA domain-containing protein, partial [Microcoleus sp. SIO2G3]|nr:VWA domain-containing protein [Microcoleus sp. SIO2G3]
FSHLFQRYRNMTSKKIEQIFQEVELQGSSNLGNVLQDALNNYFQRKADGQAKPNGETIIVITDGEPHNRMGVTEAILNASMRIDSGEELAISFIQVGSDPKASKFFKALDDQLKGIGAKFDIVDTITFKEMENTTLKDVLLKAIVD